MRTIDIFQNHTVSPLHTTAIAGGCSQAQTRKNGTTIIKTTRCTHDDCPAKKDPIILYPNGKRPKGEVVFVDATSDKKTRAGKA